MNEYHTHSINYPVLAASVCLLILVNGCSDNDDSHAGQTAVNPTINNQEHREFEHDAFGGQPCSAEPIFNCTEDLILCKDGSASIILTDIINSGTYTETDSTISTNWEAVDVPMSIFFTKQEDFSLLDSTFGLTWTLTASGDDVSSCL